MPIRKNIKTFFFILFCTSVLIYSLISLFKIITTKAPDFGIFYYSTLDFIKGVNPYTDKNLFTIYNYPPETNLIYLPLILFNYQTAQAIYVLLSYLTVFLIVFYSLKIIKPRFSIPDYWLFVCLTLLSFPVKFTLGMGQANLIAYLLLIVSYYFFQRKNDFFAGLLLGIAMVFKPILIFIYLFYLLHKSYKIIFTATAVIFILALIVFLIRPDFHIFYFKSLINNAFSFTGTEIYYNQGALGFISRLTFDIKTRKIFLYVFDFLAVFITIYCLVKHKLKKNLQFAIILTLLPIINTMSWQHHFIVLIFPFILTWNLIKKRKLIMMILAFAYLLISLNIKKPIYNNLFLNIILSHQFYGTILLYLILIIFPRLSAKINKII